MWPKKFRNETFFKEIQTITNWTVVCQLTNELNLNLNLNFNWIEIEFQVWKKVHSNYSNKNKFTPSDSYQQTQSALNRAKLAIYRRQSVESFRTCEIATFWLPQMSTLTHTHKPSLPSIEFDCFQHFRSETTFIVCVCVSVGRNNFRHHILVCCWWSVVGASQIDRCITLLYTHTHTHKHTVMMGCGRRRTCCRPFCWVAANSGCQLPVWHIRHTPS